MIQELAKRGASVNVVDSNGWTPLHWCMNPNSDLSLPRRVAIARVLVPLGSNWGAYGKYPEPSFAQESTSEFREKVFEDPQGKYFLLSTKRNRST